MLSDYHERREQKIERYNELADKNRSLSESTLKTARSMADVIPFGQPILIGHYSEKRDRNYRERIWNKFEKATELDKKADHYARKADSAENNTAISSDNPDAIQELKDKLQNLKESHKIMIEGNKIIKNKKLTTEQKIEALIKIGLETEKAKAKLRPDIMGDLGFPRYAITNSGANIRNVEKRIEYLEKQRAEVSKEYEIGNIQIIDSVENNRVMIFFPGIPSEDIRGYLKSAGFRWSPNNKAWQAYRSAAWQIPYLIKKLTAMPGYVSPAQYQFMEA